MVTSDLRAEVEIWPFRACAMYPAIIIETVRLLWTWLWGIYHVPQKAFQVRMTNLIIYTTRTNRTLYTAPSLSTQHDDDGPLLKHPQFTAQFEVWQVSHVTHSALIRRSLLCFLMRITSRSRVVIHIAFPNYTMFIPISTGTPPSGKRADLYRNFMPCCIAEALTSVCLSVCMYVAYGEVASLACKYSQHAHKISCQCHRKKAKVSDKNIVPNCTDTVLPKTGPVRKPASSAKTRDAKTQLYTVITKTHRDPSSYFLAEKTQLCPSSVALCFCDNRQLVFLIVLGFPF